MPDQLPHGQSLEHTVNDDSLRIIASLNRDRVGLELKTVDLCFLIALHYRAELAGLTCFEEETLLDVFEQVSDAVESDAENLRKRATHAIQRLRDQRLLSRVDGSGVVRAGEYSMTRLASGIVEFFLAEQVLTRESLTLLTKALAASLAEVKAAARKAAGPDAWRAKVVAPLRITVADLVAGIERRQRGLDAQQEEIQRRIGDLLQTDWFSAVDDCQKLLDETTATLAELNAVLLHDASQIQAVLSDIGQIAATGGMQEAEEACQRVGEQVDRVASWGGARQRAWSNYYQYVHRFLRDVVRLDPDRALSERLRSQLAGWSQRPFALVVASAPPIRLLREKSLRVHRPAVQQPARDREAAVENVPADTDLATVEGRVRALLADGSPSLSAVLHQVLPEVADQKRFAATGRIAGQVAAEANPRSERERPWVEVPSKIEVEDWMLKGRDNS
jgi:chromosome partition protein MukF